MDSFEINKIVAAVLMVALLVIGIGKLSDIIFHVEKPKTPGYAVNVEEAVTVSSSTKDSVEEKIDISGEHVKSPIVGTAYLSPEPGAKPFVSVGKKIKKGETLLIVEAMKTMNHVPSTKDGVVKKICVTDGQPVEFGQTIVVLE